MTIDQIQTEMGDVEARLKEWEKDRAALDAKITPAQQELEYWKGILRLRQGETELDVGIAAAGHAFEEGMAASGYGSKSNGLRSFIRARAENGVTMRELTTEAARLGAHPNMAYRLVTRLTAETDPPELERREDRIYPTAHLKGE